MKSTPIVAPCPGGNIPFGKNNVKMRYIAEWMMFLSYLSEPPDQTSFPNPSISNQNLHTNLQRYKDMFDITVESQNQTHNFEQIFVIFHWYEIDYLQDSSRKTNSS
jgi:hypothetical protein